jgi:hypothetical protein
MFGGGSIITKGSPEADSSGLKAPDFSHFLYIAGSYDCGSYCFLDVSAISTEYINESDLASSFYLR